MQTDQPSLFARDHTILGVCEALGEDFGFNPLLLRVPLAVCLLLNPYAVVATYAGLALLVAFSRFVAPSPRKPAAVAEAEASAEPAGAKSEPDMALAA